MAIVQLDAQRVGIGNTTPHTSAILDLTATTRGFLVPRMTGAQRNAIASPATGLQVYQTNSEILPFSSPGLYIYTGSGWRRMARAEEITSGTSSWTISGENQYSNVSGNVGIGTETPDTKFHVQGFAKLSYPSPGGPFLTMETTYLPVPNLPNFTGIEFRRNGSWVGSLSYYSPNGIPGNPNPIMTPGILRFSASGQNANDLVISAGGTVGIGSSSNLATKLHITNGGDASLTTHGYMVLGSTSAANMVLDANEIQARSDGAASTLRLQQDGGSLLVQGDALVVASNGNVGIGDLTPDAPLDVLGDGIFNGVNPTVALHNSNVQKGFIQLSGDDFRVGTFSDNDLGKFVVRTNGGDHFFITPTGNVGIGTSSPATKLHVSGGGLRISSSGEALGIYGNNPFVQFWHNNVAKFYMQQLGNDMHFGNSTGNNSGRLFLGAAEVAINTSGPAPGYSLSVGGEIICEELRVELQGNGPWPDYVFAKDYHLRPLSELKSFIETNKHLPNIPAAAQVEKEGFDVGDMNRRLLEKVEELTLYLLHQQDEINELRKEIEGLRN